MTSPLLLEHFDELISTPDDVEKLNRSILQLAMQGKLVEQNPNDEPAIELLKQIKEEKAKEKRGKKSAALPLIENDETPFDLPEGWKWVRLGELVNKMGAGSTPKGGKEVYTDEGTKFIRSQNVYNDGLRLDDVVYISDEINERMSGTIVQAKDILLNITGASIARCALVPDDFDSANVNQHVMIVRMIEPEIRKFVHICMISPYIYDLIMSVQVGMSREGLSIGKLEKFVLPLPPLAEQKRIVARVEELFAQTRRLAEELSHSRTELDRLNESALARLLASETQDKFNERWSFIAEHFDLLTSAPEHIAPLRQSILELAVRGKLTRREAGDESAKVVIQKIRKEHKTKLVQISEDEKPYELPEGWEWIRFGEVGDQRLGKMLDKNKNKGDYYPYLRNINVQWLRIDLSDVNQMRFQPNEIDEYKLKPDDLLICEGGEPGRCAIWQSNDLMFFQKAIHRVRPYHGIVSKYLLYHLCADAGNGTLANYFTGATIKHLTGKALAQYICALPPIAEQERIVKRVEQLLGWCDALEARLKSAEEERGRLVESVLAGVGVGG